MKDIDHLIDNAFDREQKEIEAFRKSLDGQDAREFDSLVNLKADLKKLREVPECQLTTEHLRQAVLNQKPTVAPKPALRLWTFVPVAAAAALVLAFVMKPQTVTEAPIQTAVKTGSEKSAGAALKEVVTPSNVDTADHSASIDQVVPKVTTRQEAPITVAKNTRRESGSGRSARSLRMADMREPVAAAMKTAASFDKDAKDDNPETKLGGPDERTELAMIANDVHEPLVVILDKDNPETGAAEAREVSKPDNVIFGG